MSDFNKKYLDDLVKRVRESFKINNEDNSQRLDALNNRRGSHRDNLFLTELREDMVSLLGDVYIPQNTTVVDLFFGKQINFYTKTIDPYEAYCRKVEGKFSLKKGTLTKQVLPILKKDIKEVSQIEKLITWSKEQFDKHKYKFLIGFVIVSIIVYFNSFKLTKIEKLNKERAELALELENHIKNDNWRMLKERASNATLEEDTKDVGLFYLGISEIHPKFGQKDPSIYFFQIQPDYPLYTLGMHKLSEYYGLYLRTDKETFETKFNLIFRNMEINGLGKSNLWFMTMHAFIIGKNTVFKDEKEFVNAKRVFPELLELFQNFKKTFSNSYDFENYISKNYTPMKIPEMKEYLKIIDENKVYQTISSTFIMLHSLELYSRNYMGGTFNSYWKNEYNKFKKGKDKEIIVNGFYSLGVIDTADMNDIISMW